MSFKIIQGSMKVKVPVCIHSAYYSAGKKHESANAMAITHRNKIAN